MTPSAPGVHVPGSSPLHRLPAGVKLVALLVFLTGLTVWRTPRWLALDVAVLLLLGALSGVGWRRLGGQVRPAVPIAAVVAGAQVWLAGPRAALVVTTALLAAVAAAALVTLTTRTTDLLDALVRMLRPLRRAGVDPERVGLVLALAVRSVPVLATLAAEVRDARRARGAERSVRAFAVPFVIRALRHADRLGEALAARGVDD